MTAASLTAFKTKLAAHLAELHELDERNQKKELKATFWQQNDDFTVAREVLIASSGTIGHEVTKFSLVFSKKPSKEEAASICHTLDGPCEQMLSATKVALYCGAGSALGHDIIHGAMRVLKGMHSLSEIIESEELSRVPELTGRVWESCNSVLNTPKSNCVATKRSMLQCITMLNDTINELKQFLTEQEEEESLDDVEQDDEFAFDSNLSPEERALFEGNVKLLDMVAAILKRGVLALKKLDANEDSDALIAWTCDLHRAYAAIQNSIVEAGAALYPPIDEDELSEQVNALETAAASILACLADQPEITDADSQAIEAGRAAFNSQMATVKAQIEVSRT
ncbi:TPA: hypothetical protein N0F65_009919 [Lagenidium giganteum]|uniref:Cyclin-D1-binding protein 1-like N-terminal domain-containing protein n=1 Tax=Lagenidium giganteum TaxID=4803 RepID=A0AAV2YGJ3_9STRA|nr:TPA: hypothetical protein N0F65_009919 [Lagenidium giganteum]